MSRWKERRGEKEAKRDRDEGELHSNEGMPGAVGWGRGRGRERIGGTPG